jgi:hypothetical protein
LQTSSAQRRREFGTLVIDIFVDGTVVTPESSYRQCGSEDNGHFSLSTALQPRLLVHKQQLCEPARHRRAAVLIVTQAHLFLSVILLTSTAFMGRKRKRENYCMLRSEGKIIACSNKKKAHVGNRTRTHAGIHERLDPIFT